MLVFLCLAYLTEDSILQVHIGYFQYFNISIFFNIFNISIFAIFQHFSIFFNIFNISIFFNIFKDFLIFKAEWHSAHVCICLHTHIYPCIEPFLYPFICWHLHSFHFLVTVNDDAINMGQQMFLTLFPSDIYPEVGLLDENGFLALIFWGSAMLLSVMAVLISLPTRGVQGLWLTRWLQPYGKPWVEPLGSATLEYSTWRNCEIMNACYFELLTLGVTFMQQEKIKMGPTGRDNRGSNRQESRQCSCPPAPLPAAFL